MYGSSSLPLPQGVSYIKGIVYERSPAAKRLATWLGFCLQLAFHLLLHGSRYNRLLVVSNPPFAPLLAPLARRPYSLILYDLYPQVLHQLSGDRPPSTPLRLIIAFWHWLNCQVYRRAEHIYTLSTDMAESLHICFPSTSELWSRVEVIPPWSDIKSLCPVPPASTTFRDKHSLNGKFLVTYSGNLGLTHPLEPLLDAFHDLMSRSDNFSLLLIGHGPKLQKLQLQANSLCLANVLFLDPVPLGYLTASLSAADLAVVALDGPAAAASLPSKTFSALACGTPLLVIAPLGSAISKLVHEHRCGFVVQPGPTAAEKVANLLVRLAAKPRIMSRLSANALEASRFYSPANAQRLVNSWLNAPS